VFETAGCWRKQMVTASLGVIKGVGINNDGSDKTPSPRPPWVGQVGAIKADTALQALDPGVSATFRIHGTATPLGATRIEVRALTQAFQGVALGRGASRLLVQGNIGPWNCRAPGVVA